MQNALLVISNLTWLDLVKTRPGFHAGWSGCIFHISLSSVSVVDVRILRNCLLLMRKQIWGIGAQHSSCNIPKNLVWATSTYNPGKCRIRSAVEKESQVV
jgi:hypothetical protein